MKVCKQCGKELVGRFQKKFCSLSCAASFNNKIYKKRKSKEKKKKYCIECGRELYKGRKFCNQKCQWNYAYKEYIKKWKLGLKSGLAGDNVSDIIRRYLFEKYDSKCCKCGWSEMNPTTGKVPLEVNHIDGNYKNCCEENLELICPNCHSLTPNFRFLNVGNGREKRYNK